MPNSDFSSRFDHLVVCADNCAHGVQWFTEQSGLRMPAGGQHPHMGTHNHLTALSEHSFLEIIALDPSASAVSCTRWFRLDEEDFQRRLAVSPLLSTWVVATDNLQKAISSAAVVGIDAGEPVSLTRGDLSWQIALRADGTLACDGTFPILIQWPETVNPVERMVDQGLRLSSLSASYPDPDKLERALTAIGASHMIRVSDGPSALCAELRVAERAFQLNNTAY